MARARCMQIVMAIFLFVAMLKLEMPIRHLRRRRIRSKFIQQHPLSNMPTSSLRQAMPPARATDLSFMAVRRRHKWIVKALLRSWAWSLMPFGLYHRLAAVALAQSWMCLFSPMLRLRHGCWGVRRVFAIAAVNQCGHQPSATHPIFGLLLAVTKPVGLAVLCLMVSSTLALMPAGDQPLPTVCRSMLAAPMQQKITALIVLRSIPMRHRQGRFAGLVCRNQRWHRNAPLICLRKSWVWTGWLSDD